MGKMSSTKPPRQREGKPFPGGKRMRKALAKLKARREHVADKARHQHHKPGSMK